MYQIMPLCQNGYWTLHASLASHANRPSQGAKMTAHVSRQTTERALPRTHPSACPDRIDPVRSLSTTLFPPAARKTLRSFSSGEVAKIVGVSDGYLRQFSLDGLGPGPEDRAGRSTFIHAWPRSTNCANISHLSGLRRHWISFRGGVPGEKLQVLTVVQTSRAARPKRRQASI